MLMAGKRKIANTGLVEGGVDITDTEGVRGCDAILVRLIKEKPETKKLRNLHGLLKFAVKFQTKDRKGFQCMSS